MSRYFPHPAYAEDQPLAKTILTTHVLTRAVTMGSVIGTGIFGVSDVVRRIRKIPPPRPRPQMFLRSVGTSTLITFGFLSVALAGRMWGREEIEWKDRSWRLMENKGQLETDDWTYGGMASGLAAYGLAGAPLGLVGAAGAMSTGSLVGLAGYLGWRYGINKGKFPGDN